VNIEIPEGKNRCNSNLFENKIDQGVREPLHNK